jgi:cytoplasmic iron level regulating protein YaaA (DUF328/UPF0246 family)
MFTILLHSSKTMRQDSIQDATYQPPAYIDSATTLGDYLKSLSLSQIQTAMKLSERKAAETYTLLHEWNNDSTRYMPAIDAFLGDIYSGLRSQSFSNADRARANQSLFILSGLYGIIRALDSIQPYRLEMGYRLPDQPYNNLYSFWGNKLASVLPKGKAIINCSAVEYTKAIFPHLPKEQRIIHPRFLTLDPHSGEPKFVVVHAKIARGAFAHWLITHDINSEESLKDFHELNYAYSETLSTSDEPVYICQTFGGLGLSVRLT